MLRMKKKKNHWSSEQAAKVAHKKSSPPVFKWIFTTSEKSKQVETNTSSSDLSPIENLQRIMKIKVEKARNRTVKEQKEDLVKTQDKTTFNFQVFHGIYDKTTSNGY